MFSLGLKQGFSCIMSHTASSAEPCCSPGTGEQAATPLRSQQDPVHLSLEAAPCQALLYSFLVGMHGRTESCAKSVCSGMVWMLRKCWHVPPSASVLPAICHLPPHWGLSLFPGKGRLGSTGWNSCAVLGLSWTHCTLSCSPKQWECVETGGGKISRQPFVESHS